MFRAQRAQRTFPKAGAEEGLLLWIRGTDRFGQLVVPSITPVLTVRSTAAAVEFYKAAFGAIEISRVDASDGQLVIDLAIGQARFRVVDEAPTASNLSPETLGGTSVRLNLLVEEPDATAAQAVAAGAVEVFPIADQPYGLRQGRFADPFGHHWLIGKPLPVGLSSPRNSGDGPRSAAPS